MFQALAQNTDLKERLRRIHAESLLLEPPAADSLAEVGKAPGLVRSGDVAVTSQGALAPSSPLEGCSHPPPGGVPDPWSRGFLQPAAPAPLAPSTLLPFVTLSPILLLSTPVSLGSAAAAGAVETSVLPLLLKKPQLASSLGFLCEIHSSSFSCNTFLFFLLEAQPYLLREKILLQ